MSSTNPSNPNFDERKWVINILRTLEDELEYSEPETRVSIFNVPRALMISDPESYTPQQVSIGPYHCKNPELYEMQRYKLAAARRIRKQLNSGLKFQDIVDELAKLDVAVRGCYHRLLDLNHETLAWMMAIDASFLLVSLEVFVSKPKVPAITRTSSLMMSHLVDFEGRKSAHNAILRDIVMLENQIPLFVLRKVLEAQLSSLERTDASLLSMLVGFCKEVSPFNMIMEDVTQSIHVSRCPHLLHFLYDVIVPKLDASPCEIAEITSEVDDQNGQYQDASSNFENNPVIRYLKRLLQTIWKLISNVFCSIDHPDQCFRKLVASRPAKVLICIPWAIVSRFPVVSLLKQPVEELFSSQGIEGDQEHKARSRDLDHATKFDKPPLLEEIAIPSVSELSESGFHFASSNGNMISSIHFEVKTLTLYLPVISLDINAETVLRNLVAYEASSASGPLIFTRYTELMNGIIDSEEDVKLLREKGIIMNHLKSDQEAANLWNGMSKSIRLTKVPFLDKVIDDVNKHYDSRWKFKVLRFIKGKFFGSLGQLLAFSAWVLILVYLSIRVLHR